MCEYGGFQTAPDREMAGGWVLRRVSVNGRIRGTRMSSTAGIEKVSLSRGVVGGDVKCTERALQDVTNCRFAQPASCATEACTEQAVKSLGA